MGALHHMMLIRYANTMLPIICVGICQLIVLTTCLIGDIEHASEMNYHLLLLESHGYHLRICGLQLS